MDQRYKIKSENEGFDGFFDFDILIRDPNDESKIFKKYDKGDGLHPSREGHKKLLKQQINQIFLQKSQIFK